MTRTLNSIATTILSAVLLTACGRADKVPQDSKPIDSAAPAEGKESAAPAEAQAFLGYTLGYQADAVLQNDQILRITGYNREAEPFTEEILAQDYNVNLEEWWNGISGVEHILASTEERNKN